MANPTVPSEERAMKGISKVMRAAMDTRILEMTARGATTEEIRVACGFKHRSSVVRRRDGALKLMSEDALRRFEIQALKMTAAIYDEGMRLLQPADGLPPTPAAYTAALAGHKRLTEFAGLGAAAKISVDISGEIGHTVAHQIESELPELQGLLDQLVVAGYGSGRTPGEQYSALASGPVQPTSPREFGEDEDDADEDDDEQSVFDAVIVGGVDADDDDTGVLAESEGVVEGEDASDAASGGAVGGGDEDGDEDEDVPGRWVDGKLIPFWQESQWAQHDADADADADD